MTDANAPRALNCPNCGAPLDFPPGKASVRCRFCDSTIERSLSDLTDDDDAHIIQIDGAALGTTSSPARRFVLKMRNGQPVLIEATQPPDSPARPPNKPRPPSRPVDPEYARRAAANAMPRRRSQARSDKSSPVGCIIAVGAVLAVFVGMGYIFLANNAQAGLMLRQVLAGNFEEAWITGGTITSNLLLTQSAVYVPGEGDEAADQALVLSIHYPASEGPREFRMVAIDLEKRELLWQSAALAPELYDTRILYDTDRLYVVAEERLVALDRTNGKTVWTATLADEVSLNICEGCLQLVDGRLAALSDDGTLEVFDAVTGESEWSLTAEEASPRGLYVVGGRLVFMDRNADVRGVLRTFDPATGAEEAVVPVCRADESSEDYADWTTRLQPAPDGQSVYLAFGSYPSCLQRWEAEPLQMAWSATLPEDFAPNLDSVAPVFGDDALYLAAGPYVLAVNTVNGDVRELLADEDQQFGIEGVYADNLLLRAQRTRGTTRYALWNVAAGSGAVRWTVDLGDQPPMDLGGIIDTNAPDWIVQATPAGARLLRFQGNEDDRSHAIINETLAWDSGESTGPVKTVLGLPTIIFSAPSWLHWQGDTLWMVIENKLLAFDAAGYRVSSRWP